MNLNSQTWTIKTLLKDKFYNFLLQQSTSLCFFPKKTRISRHKGLAPNSENPSPMPMLANFYDTIFVSRLTRPQWLDTHIFLLLFFSIELIFCLSMYFFVIKLPYVDKMGLVYNCSVFCCVWYMFFKIKNIVLSSIHYNQLNITMFVISYHNSKSFCQYNSLRAHFIWHNSICPIFSMKLRNAGIFL